MRDWCGSGKTAWIGCLPTIFKVRRRTFKRIPWEQAIDDVAKKLSAIVNEHGPRSFALMGAGTIGCPSQGVFAVNVLRGLGSQYYYNALAQELTGRYWADGKTYGNQALHTKLHMEETDMLLTVG